MSKFRTYSAKRAKSERESEVRKESRLSSRSRHYDNLSKRGSDRVLLTQAAGGLESTGQQVAGRDFPMNSISIQSTAEMV